MMIFVAFVLGVWIGGGLCMYASVMSLPYNHVSHNLPARWYVAWPLTIYLGRQKRLANERSGK